MFGGPIAGIFLWGYLQKGQTEQVLFLGAFISVIVEILLGKTSIYFMYYGMAGVAVSFIGGYLLSFLFKEKKNITGLTYFTVNEEVVS